MRTASLPAVLLAAVAVAQDPTCRLEGLVQDPMLEPVANAEVVACRDGEVVARTFADGSGRFVFGALPQRVVTLRATGSLPEVGGAWLDLLGLERQFVTVAVIPARTVRGVVRDADGRAIADAFVLALPLADADVAVAMATARTDADGRFALHHVPVHDVELRAWAPGHEGLDERFGGVDDLEVSLQLEAPARSERSFTIVAAEPPADARLEVTAFHRGRPVPLPAPLRTPPRVDGVWRLCGWSLADEVQAHVVVSSGTCEPAACSVPAHRSGGLQEFVWKAEAAAVRGVLRGGDLPAGTWIVAEPMDGPGRRTFGRIDADGAFVLPAPVAAGQRFALRVLHAGWMFAPRSGESGTWWIDRVGDDARALPIVPAREVTLRLVDATGQPAAGVRVRIVDAAASIDRGERPPPPWGAEPLANGITGGDGGLHLGGLDLAPGRDLACVAEGAAGWTMHRFTARDARRIDLGDLRLEAGCVLEIHVGTEAAPAPVAASVEVRDLGIYPPTSMPRICDHRGRLRLVGLFAGRHQVSARNAWTIVELRPDAPKLVRLEW